MLNRRTHRSIIPSSEIRTRKLATDLPGLQLHVARPEIPATEEQAVIQAQPKPARLLSLDAFRGLTIALMLLVNNIAVNTATPVQLQHAAWAQAIHLADLVFPWFLFCVGVAIPFAVASFQRKVQPSWRYDLKVLGRTAALLLLGILLDSSTAKHPTFSLGVLQIIALAYLIGALLYGLPLFRRMLIAGLMLVGYWAAIKFITVPGGAGAFGETHNLVLYLNQNLFGGFKIGPFELSLWGLPSVVPTAALVLIGTAVGDLLRHRDMKVLARALSLLAVSLVLTGAGILWSFSLLLSKTIWTPSYILVCAGTGTLLLGLFYLLLDVRGWRWWAFPLLVLGANAILAYVAPILVKVTVLQSWHITTGVTLEQWAMTGLVARFGAIRGGWLYTLAYMLGWWVILWQLYRRKIFLRV